MHAKREAEFPSWIRRGGCAAIREKRIEVQAFVLSGYARET
jgi:hypothetical protein